MSSAFNGVPIVRHKQGSLQIGSDNRFAKLILDADDGDFTYIANLVGANRKMPNEVRDLFDQQHKSQIHQTVNVAFKHYPQTTIQYDIMRQSYFTVQSFMYSQASNGGRNNYYVTEFAKQCVILLAKSNAGAIYLPDRDFAITMKSTLLNLGLKTKITHTKPEHLDFGIIENAHEYLIDSANDLMMNHIPYIVAVLRGTDAIVGPLNSLGQTPCLNCAALTLSQASHSSNFIFGATNHNEALNSISAGMAVSAAIDYLSNGKATNVLTNILTSPIMVKYSKLAHSSECGCMEVSYKSFLD